MVWTLARRREMRDPRFFPGLAALVVGGCVALSGPVLAADDDGDGWYSDQRNERVTLVLVGATASREGDYFLTVDGVRFPHGEKDLDIAAHLRPDRVKEFDCAVASRAIGVWGRAAGSAGPSWTSRIVVSRPGTPGARAAATVTWTNRPGEQSVILSLSPDDKVRLVFRATVETFADPDPRNADGDADRDGLLDREEADYAKRGLALGDPLRKDLILVVGHAHADWRMTSLTQRLLRTRFHQRGIHLYLAADEADSLGLCRPGLVQLGDAPFAHDHAISLDEARRIRAANLQDPLAKHAHLVILAARVSPHPETAWGWAEMPGATLVVRSHLPVLGPDFHEYQAKTILHELGHNLGLSHPDRSDQRSPTGPIPAAERNSASTVMGTPRTDRGNPVAALANAWARPLDYAPTQWKNARFDWVRRKNRPEKNMK